MDPSDLRSETESRRLTVFYHGNCPDGITGAWAVYEALPPVVRADLAALGGFFAAGSAPRQAIPPLLQQSRAGAVFHGLAHGEPLPAAALLEGRHVVYVDISPPPEHATSLVEAAATLTVLDHHRGAQASLAALQAAADTSGGRFAARFTEELSGAQLAWDWAHRPPPEREGSPARDDGPPRPEVVDYVADRDLWRWELEGSRAVNKALYIEGAVLSVGSLAALRRAHGDALPDGLAARGASYLGYERSVLAALAGRAYPATVAALFPGEAEPREYCVLAVNASCLPSELGELLMEEAKPDVHFAVIWSLGRGGREIWASARTTRPDVDLSVIVPRLVGIRIGGGHPRAAGFVAASDSPSAFLRPQEAAPPSETRRRSATPPETPRP